MRNLIRGVGRPLLRLLRRDESGAVAVIVALMLGMGVLTGIGALVIDVGQLYVEQGQLQNGADAAALAVAKSCATGTCTPSLALTYADENSRDGVAAVPLVCGSGTLGACAASTGKVYDCPAVPPAGTNYVDVHTSTKTATGGTVIPPIFAGTLHGNSGYTGTTVLACAQAEWGGVPSSPGIITAFTISACEWVKATTTGTVYGPVPPTAPSSTLDQVLKVRSVTGTGCTGYAAPDDAISLFGWITETGGCTLNSISGTTYSVKSGTASANCNTPLYDDAQDKTEIYIPVYTSVTGSGATAVYNLLGIAAFVVTGYNIPGSSFDSYTDWLKASNQCTGTTYCINGYFVNDLQPYTGSFGTSSLGLNAIKLSG